MVWTLLYGSRISGGWRGETRMAQSSEGNGTKSSATAQQKFPTSSRYVDVSHDLLVL
jgi:hypothetical protein